MAKRRRFTRETGTRPYKKLFIIATEGSVTEPQYFNMFNGHDAIIRIKCIKGKNKSAPKNVLKLMKNYLKNETTRKDDEAWLVIDKDQWQDNNIDELFQWSFKNEKYNVAVTNPKFEFWLLLHFEDGKNADTPRKCADALNKYLPNYKKHINIAKITEENIKDAIERAERKDNPPCKYWPKETGKTTVYKLVKKLIN